jgi:hypothetical protein
MARQNQGKAATKVFLTQDTVGDSYVCYLQSVSKQLAVVRYELTKKKPLFGPVNFLPALDAQPVTGLQMTLVLDPQHTLTLYSGLVKVSRVMFNSTPNMSTIANDISALNLNSGAGTMQGTPLGVAEKAVEGKHLLNLGLTSCQTKEGVRYGLYSSPVSL